jgi:hypothetical protein
MKNAGGKKRWHLANVTLDNTDTVLQAITYDILLRLHRQRPLQFEPNEVCRWETTRQQERYDTTASAEVNTRVCCPGRYKVRQHKGFQGKAVAVRRLV